MQGSNGSKTGGEGALGREGLPGTRGQQALGDNFEECSKAAA